VRQSAPGHVELWPSIAAQAVEEPDDWTQPIDHTSAPAALLAAASHARSRAGSTGRAHRGPGPARRPGDVLVLVRKRDSFVHALSRELKQLGVPVAGADRLSLADHIAVQDLMAIGRIVLQPDDDLSLAALLKSPVFGFPRTISSRWPAAAFRPVAAWRGCRHVGAGRAWMGGQPNGCGLAK
jgi:ATP-dependent helicase/nuclease subunit A